MKLAIIFLNDVELLDEIMSAFLEIGVTGATICDSVGMGRIISHDIPIFAGLSDAFVGSSPSNKIIFIATMDIMIKKIVQVLSDIAGDVKTPGGPKMLTINIDQTFGIAEE